MACDKKGRGRLAASALARATQVLLLRELVASPVAEDLLNVAWAS